MFEDSRREIYGGLNLHDHRELNNHRVVAEGFTWGLVPFGPAYAFAEFNFARELLGVDSDQVSYVMIKLKPGANLAEAKRDLQARVPEADVVTSDELRGTIRNFVLWDQGVERGHTVLVVTHDSRIFELADRIEHLEDGLIIKAESASIPSTNISHFLGG